MKTIVIYDSMGLNDIKFFVKEGDFSEFNNQYINSADCSNAACDFINSLEDKDALTEFPVDQVEPDTKVIVCGFIP
jgi:hypothetical protein